MAYKTFAKISTVTLLMVIGFLLGGQQKASAATACAITGGTHDDYAGLVVETGYIDDSGTLVGAKGNNMDIEVTTTTNPNGQGTSTPAGNVVDATPAQIALKNDTTTDRAMTRRFRSIVDNNTGTYCPTNPGNTAVILRGNGNQGSFNDAGTYNRWMLDCDYSKHPSYYQHFLIHAEGVPDGARAGGTWSADLDRAPANGESVRVRMVYTQPPDTAPKLSVFQSNPSCTANGSFYIVAYDPDIAVTNGDAKMTVTIKDSNGVTASYVANQQESGFNSNHQHAYTFDPSLSPFNYNKYSQTVSYTFSTSGLKDSAGNTSNLSAPDPGNPFTFTKVSCNSPPTGSISVSCAADGQATLNFNDNDGSTTAYAKLTSGQQSPTYSSSPSTWTITQYAGNSSVTVQLYVKDVGTQGDGNYHLVDSKSLGPCDQVPSITLTPPACGATNVTGNATDPDYSPLTVSVSGNSQTHTYTTDASGNFSFNISDFGGVTTSVNYTATVASKLADGSAGLGSNTRSANATVIACSCGNVLSTPTLIEPSDNFTFTVSVNYGASMPAGAYFKVTGDISPVPNLSASQSGNTITSASSPSFSESLAKDYIVNWEFDNSSGATILGGCSRKIPVVDLPYFNVFGNDISAGGDFGCSATTGILRGWYNNGTPLAGGASTQFGATSLGQIIGVASSRISDTTAPTTPGGPPTGLTFANQDPAALSSVAYSPKLGGNFSATAQHCLYQPKVNSTTPEAAMSSVNTLPNGVHTVSGSINGLSGGGLLGKTQNIVIESTGDVYINGDIKYDDSAAAGWDKDNVPSFMLEAQGNIWISPSVKMLDGIYIAHGNIYTCASSLGTKVPQSSLYGTCNNQLVVHGSFIAKQVRLMRTLGSLKNSTNTEDSATRGAACLNVQAGSTTDSCAAEVFEFSPEMFLGKWQSQQSGLGSVQYDSISALPPVL